MTLVPIQFRYHTSLDDDVFPHATAYLEGSWSAEGRLSSNWSRVAMIRKLDDSDCPMFEASVALDTADAGRDFRWGVSLVRADGSRQWVITTEIHSFERDRYRTFRFTGQPETHSYYLTHCRRLGANRCRRGNGSDGVRFAVWAPNATQVEVVFGKIWDADDPAQVPLVKSMPPARIAGGYIAADGTGQDPRRPALRMVRRDDGIWSSDSDDPALCEPNKPLEHWPYMFRVTRADGSIVYRTDLYSRCQIGYGSKNPQRTTWNGRLSDLDGTVSCSVTVDPKLVTKYFAEEPPYLPAPAERVWPERSFVTTAEFWANEFGPRPVPRRVQDLIIYELHLGALGFGKTGPGTLADAVALLDHLVELNFNAVELLPLSEFGGGGENWGYATSHYFAIEYAGGGRDQFKFFVRECHQRGIAVIMDVVYNHFAHDAERAQWHYDTTSEPANIYYWYEGQPDDYPTYQAAARDPHLPNPPALNHGGYVDNLSTSYAPRYHEENVRQLFISSAVSLMREFHVDGFRVDQTTSIHGYNALHADGRQVGAANVFGAKLLREFGRTLRLLQPDVMLMAEDHSEWEEVTLECEAGGMGFDARWYADFCHHLAGDTDRSSDYAKLIYEAGRRAFDSDRQLAISHFAGALRASAHQKVVYVESHDEAGNSKGPFLDPHWQPQDNDKQFTSHRGLMVASNGAPLWGETRRLAEARCRYAWGLTVLSAGTPLALFGEEVGAVQRFKYNQVLANKEDIAALRRNSGAQLARFYAEVNALRLFHQAFRSRQLAICWERNDHRMLAFERWENSERFLVVASLHDEPHRQGYTLRHDRLGGSWREIFNSDSALYGGDNVGNGGRSLPGGDQGLTVVVPRAGFVVLRHEQ